MKTLGIFVFSLVFISLFLLTQNSFSAVDKSLILCLTFDEGNGDVTKDVSEYNHEAKLTNKPKWVDGKRGKALQFDGTNYVIVPITDDLQLTEKFTVNFWVKRDDVQPVTWNYMVAAGTLKWAVIYNNGQKGYIYSTSAGTWAQRLMTDKNIEPEWTYIAVTYDVDKGVEWYVNGEDKPIGAGVKPPKVDAIDGSIMVGARHPGQEFFRGIIDEVAIYNRILTLDEIKRDMDGIGGLAVSPKSKLASTWGNIKEAN